MVKKKTGKGGARPGAGRKPIDPMRKKIPYNTKLPRWLVEWLQEQPNAAVTIENALTKQHDLI